MPCTCGAIPCYCAYANDTDPPPPGDRDVVTSCAPAPAGTAEKRKLSDGERLAKFFAREMSVPEVEAYWPPGSGDDGDGL